VFADPSARRDLEAIVHPIMIEDFERTIAEAERTGSAPAVVLDAAILMEAGWDRECDVVVFVDAAPGDRLARVERARGWSRADFEAREAAQLPPDAKRRRADYVLPNVAGADELAVEVDRFCEWLRALDRPAGARLVPGPLGPPGVRAGAT
jgi:dephospho-CoA kinase